MRKCIELAGGPVDGLAISVHKDACEVNYLIYRYSLTSDELIEKHNYIPNKAKMSPRGNELFEYKGSCLEGAGFNA